MRHLLPILVVLCAPALAAQPDALMHVDNAPGAAFGLPVAVHFSDKDFASLAGPAEDGAPAPAAVITADGKPVCIAAGRDRDRLYVVLPPGTKGPVDVALYLRARPPADAAPPSDQLKLSTEDGRLTVANAHYVAVHDCRKMAGLPSRIVFQGGRTFENFVLNDRLYDPAIGAFPLRSDPEPSVKAVAVGPGVAQVEVAARYMRDDKPAPGNPRATYRFTYFAGSPLVNVDVSVRQEPGSGGGAAHAWQELHVLEINLPDEFFKSWAGGDPQAEGPLKADKSSHRGIAWGALLDGDHGLGLLHGGGVTIYDGRGEYGTYLHGPWTPWNAVAWSGSTSLWIGRAPRPAEAMARVASAALPAAYLTTPALQSALEDCRRRTAELPPGADRSRLAWLTAIADRVAHRDGRLADAGELLKVVAAALKDRLSFEQALARLPQALAERWTFVQNDSVGVLIDRGLDGLAVVSLFDLARGRELLAGVPAPLWELDVRTGAAGSAPARATSADGWRDLKVVRGGAGAELRWSQPAWDRLRGIAVSVSLRLDGPATHWRMKVDAEAGAPVLCEIVFPNLALAATDADNVIVPIASGRLHRRPVASTLRYSGEYPSGWLSMQCAGLVGPAGGTYVALHDPLASTKRLAMDTSDGHLRLTWKWPAPRAAGGGAPWEQTGDLVVRPFAGDWFDFAQLYREWAAAEAAWWPRGKQAGRPDTPPWMKEVAAWAMIGGDAKAVVPQVTKFAKYLDVPTAFHWYNWHQVPFDTDYPHYFPAKPGFAEGVRELQAAGVRVMPYINGRLWDTGLEDFRTTGVAAACKDEQGRPYIEEYGSGRKLAPMCPTTDLWRKTVRETVLRLQSDEFGVDGVYIDQVAAASPRLCFDPSHGHPLGGGHWWTEGGYWPMLRDLRSAMAADRPGKMITTECNAEPYIHLFDGYLTWHFQEDDAVPLFAAVYGGQVQLFSRAYQGESWKGLAMRMKTAQALVWGEQLGWITPAAVDDPVAGPFFRQCARLRHALRRYLADGRMARPPPVKDDGATVTADWQWSGKRIVTTPAVLSGAWQSPEGGLAVIFVNADDQPHTVRLSLDAAAYGFKAAGDLLMTTRTGQEPRDAPPPKPERVARIKDLPLALEPRAAIALELAPTAPAPESRQ